MKNLLIFQLLAALVAACSLNSVAQLTPPLPPDPGSDSLALSVFSIDELPVFESVAFSPDTMYNGADFILNRVSALVSDDGVVNSVTLKYSSSQGSYQNEIALSNTGGNTWEADLEINEADTFYYVISAIDNSFQSVQSDEQIFVIHESISTEPIGEPSNHAEDFRLTRQNRNNFTLEWGYMVGDNSHEGFILLVSEGTLPLPEDGEMYTADYNLNDGYGLFSIADTSLSVQITIPGYESAWDCVLIPYSGTGSAINYKTDETIPQITLFTPLNDMPNAWINEFHYDNDGTDIDEKVEVIIENSSQYDLNDFQLLLYNGSDGGLQTSGTKSFPEIPDGIEGAFDIFVIPVPSIQNGPEAIALVYRDDVIQFLGYEGTVSATEGPANNMTSVDIGVEETTSTTIGHSLQLSGTGGMYESFTWNDPQQSTFGALNTNQSLTVQVKDETTWNGSVSDSWNNNENWSNGIPGESTKAIIPAGCNFYPVLTSQADCKTLVVESDASLSGQDFLPENAILYAKREMSSGKWLFFTPPVTGMSCGILEPGYGTIYLITYDNNQPQDGNTWHYTDDKALPLNPMEGYGLLSTREALVLEFTGQPLTQSLSKELSYTPGGNNWNFTGNPFLGSLKWNSFTLMNTTNSAYLFDPDNKTYITIDSDGKINGGSEDGYIPPLQGFFVESTSSATSTLEISSAVNSNHFFYKSGVTEEEFVQIKVRGNNGCDLTAVKFSENNSDDFIELEDSRKLLYYDIGVPQAFFTLSDDKVSIMQLRNYPEYLPFGIWSSDREEVVIEAVISDNFNDSINIILKDSLTGESFDIRENMGVTLALDSGNNINRFSLSFIKKSGNTNETVTSSPDISEISTQVYAIENGIKIVSNKLLRGAADVYNIEGKKIASKQLNGNNTCNIQTGKGVFIVRLAEDRNVFTTKVIVR